MARQFDSYTEEIAARIANFDYSQIPSEVITQAKNCILDSIACTLGARKTEMGMHLVEFAKQVGGPKEASLLGETTRVNVSMATWANCSVSNLLDMDDTFAGFAHIGNAVIPAALAIAEMTRASGHDLLTAVVIGYEVAARIGLAVWPSPTVDRVKGFQSSWKVFGTVTAAGKLLSLSRDQIVQAFGLAGACAPIPMSRLKGHLTPRGWNKNVHCWGAMTGVFWTLLAKQGFQGVNTILDGDGGFWQMAGSDRCDYEIMTEPITRFHIMDNEFKPYSSCRWSHSTVDAFRAILAELPAIEEIAEIHVACLKGRELSNRYPKNMVEGQFSIPHVLAMVALNRPAGVAWMQADSFSDPVVKRMYEKVTVETDPEAEDLFVESRGGKLLSKVRVKTKSGTILEKRVEYPKGTPGKNPFTQEDFIQKFNSLSVGTFDGTRQRKVLHIISHLEQAKTIDELIATLASPR